MAANGAREALIAGVGSTPFGKREGEDIVGLAIAAARDALDDSGVPADRVQAIYLGNFIGERLAAQGSLAPVVALLLWTYVSSYILFLGAELASEYGRLRLGLERGVPIYPAPEAVAPQGDP